MVTRIQVGSEVVASDDAVAGPLNIKHPLRRDATVVYPFGDGLWGHTDGAREIGLGTERSEGRFKEAICHGASLIHEPFMSINSVIMDDNPSVDDNCGSMPTTRIPEPENYATFQAWIIALCDYAGSQAKLARGASISPQMLTKYRNGGLATRGTLTKLANYSGISYAKLRMLSDGKPAAEASAIKDRINQTSTPMGAQIGRQWEQIQDERHRSLVAEQIKLILDQQQKLSAAARKKTG